MPQRNSPLSRKTWAFWLSLLLKAETFARDICQRRWGLPARLTNKLIAVSYNLVSCLSLHCAESQSDMKIESILSYKGRYSYPLYSYLSQNLFFFFISFNLEGTSWTPLGQHPAQTRSVRDSCPGLNPFILNICTDEDSAVFLGYLLVWPPS